MSVSGEKDAQSRFIRRLAERSRAQTGRDIDLENDPYLEIIQLFFLCTEEALVKLRMTEAGEKPAPTGLSHFRIFVMGAAFGAAFLLAALALFRLMSPGFFQ